MYRRDDPRLRRTLNQLSQNLESANESAQAGLYDFSQHYINPCFASVAGCLRDCTEPCFPIGEDRHRRHRVRSRGRAEANFDFYDDWEDEENDVFGWGNDELESLLAGSSSQQPGRQRAMSYGARRDGRTRRKSAVLPHDGGPDPTEIPHSTYIGFLGRLPWKIGGKPLRYKPSAADLQDHPGALRKSAVEEQPLIDESDEEPARVAARHKRSRSETATSGHTSDSLSSRGDIFPSEDEIDDAVPLDDEFAMALERTKTGMTSDENSSSKAKSARRAVSNRTVSSRSTRESARRSGDSARADVKHAESTVEEIPTLSELKREEERVQKEEEEELERKRSAARRLAAQRGLHSDPPTVRSEYHSSCRTYADVSQSPSVESKEGTPLPTSPSEAPLSSPPRNATPMSEARSPTGTVPFPAFDAPTPQDTPAKHALSPEHASPRRPSSSQQEDDDGSAKEIFIPAQMPHFSKKPD